MAKNQPFYWREPTIILGSWIIGILLCVGHFLFYNSLQGTSPNDEMRSVAGYHFTSQQLNLAVGTTFAFLVKSAFVLAASTSYFLMFWRTMVRRSGESRPPTLSSLDSTFAALSDVVALLRLPLLMRFPLLLLMAASVWLLPIPSFITPATLSVAFGLANAGVSLQKVPSINFSTLSYLAGLTPAGYYNNTHAAFIEWGYNGPSNIINKLAEAVATEGTIQPITPPYMNSTWQLQFHGPALQCSNFSAAEVKSFHRNMMTAVSRVPVGDFSYLSWVSTPDLFTTPLHKRGAAHWQFPNIDSNIIGDEKVTPEIIFSIATSPYRSSLTRVFDWRKRGIETLIKCRCIKTTYLVDFDYTDNKQTVTHRTIDSDASIPAPVLSTFNSVNPWFGHHPNRKRCLQLSANLSRTITEDGHPATDGSTSEAPSCSWNPVIADTLAHQALFEAYTNLIVGNISKWEKAFPSSAFTNVFTTALVNTKEMKVFADIMPNYEIPKEFGGTLQSTLAEYNSTEKEMAIARAMSGIPALKQTPAASNRSLGDALEEMFANFTISLMSNPMFCNGGPGTGTEPVRAQVTAYHYENTYVFAVVPFVAAYTAAAVLSLISVTIGLYIIASTRETYDRRFSTLVRVARGADLSVPIREEHSNGCSPLPPYLAKATFRIRRGAQQSAEDNGEDGGKSASTRGRTISNTADTTT